MLAYTTERGILVEQVSIALLRKECFRPIHDFNRIFWHWVQVLSDLIQMCCECLEESAEAPPTYPTPVPLIARAQDRGV